MTIIIPDLSTKTRSFDECLLSVYGTAQKVELYWLAVRSAGIPGQLLQSPCVYPLTFRRSFRNVFIYLACLADFICHRYDSLFCQRLFDRLTPV